MKFEVKFTNQFKKDLNLANKQGKDTEKLFEVIEKLSNAETLDSKYRDHDLTGSYKGCRECHVELAFNLRKVRRYHRTDAVPCVQSFRFVPIRRRSVVLFRRPLSFILNRLISRQAEHQFSNHP